MARRTAKEKSLLGKLTKHAIDTLPEIQQVRIAKNLSCRA